MEGEPYDGGEEAIVPSSRICIKNVPKYVEEKRLREHFAAKGEVTDVKLLRTRDGQSRQMAFVGFKSEADAAAALKYFNNSYIDTFKLSVEFARKYGDTSIARPWSRHSEGSSAAARAKGPTGPVVVDGSAEEQSVRAKKGSKGGGAGENPEVADPRLAEFMALMAPRVKAKTWANDDMLPSGVEDHHKLQAAAHVAVKSSKEAAAALDSAGGIDDSDNEDEYQEIGGRGGAADGAAGRLGDESDDSSDGAADGGGDSGDDSEGEGGGAAAPAPARGDDAGVSDLDYLRSKVVHKWSDSDDEDGEGAVGTSGRGGAAAAAARGSQAGVGTSAPAATATKASARAPKAKAKPAPPPDGSDDDGGGDDGDEAEAEASEGGDAGEGEGGDGADADAGDGENSGWKAVMAAARGDAMDTDGGGGGGGGGGGVTVTAVDDVVATIADTGRLFVRNLAYTACEADLSELFGGFGDLGEVHLVLDRETKRSKRYARARPRGKALQGWVHLVLDRETNRSKVGAAFHCWAGLGWAHTGSMCLAEVHLVLVCETALEGWVHLVLDRETNRSKVGAAFHCWAGLGWAHTGSMCLAEVHLVLVCETALEGWVHLVLDRETNRSKVGAAFHCWAGLGWAHTGSMCLAEVHLVLVCETALEGWVHLVLDRETNRSKVGAAFHCWAGLGWAHTGSMCLAEVHLVLVCETALEGVAWQRCGLAGVRRVLDRETKRSKVGATFHCWAGLGWAGLGWAAETKRPKGVAYILFAIPSDAVKAAEQLDMTIFQGRLLHILPAKAAPTRVPRDGDGAFGNPDGFKSEKDAARKADAGNRSAWSTLFMRADTVAEAVAAHYGVAKSELLDRTASDLPVRMALGEAQVVAQTKGALSDAGVDIAKLEAAAAVSGKAAQTAGAAVARSATTLLVKNLPYSADEGELEELFGRHGPVVRLVLPPTKTLALVEFGEPSDARSAFKAIAYKKYQHVPLYLEWAPKDIFSTPPPDKPKASAASSKKAAAALAKASAASKQPDAKAKEDPKAGGARGGAAAAADDGGDDGDGATVASIYVKNLAWGTADAGLRKHFDRAVSAAGGTLRSAKVAKKAGPDGAPLSMGFGFVEVDTEDIAKAVIKALQGSMLDKHKLSLQLSRAKAPASAGKDGSSKKRGAAGDDGSTKVVVRNVAFEATRKDIAALFSPFGHLKSCRLPKKFDGSHRGFGFVEFVTKQEAKNAMEGVGGTHLYGRRLVVEYAQEEGGLDELRLKTGAKFREDDELLGPGSGPSMKRLRKGL
ncbi:hypothetical protein FOA52_008459 [Chlamydomonas sp. UWO 241]|nr:hypothetical protein FOA52_008459 [Chlamydomonas sp. UWO 241]